MKRSLRRGFVDDLDLFGNDGLDHRAVETLDPAANPDDAPLRA
jgi:hypothetical protein